jgi:single-strand DNA-binding protein
MQRIEIIGRIGADATVKDLNKNQVINFSVAVSESYTKDGEKITNTTWFEISKWGNNTSVSQYIKKGGLIYVSGKVNNRSWIKEDGTAQVVNGINAFEIELLGSKEDSSSESPPRQERPQANQSNSFVDGPFPENEDDSDLPF